MGLTQITAGYVPLLDSAVLLATEEFGFAESEGLHLNLVRETSWANIRDRTSLGHFDVSLVLAPMPIAAAAETRPIVPPPDTSTAILSMLFLLTIPVSFSHKNVQVVQSSLRCFESRRYLAIRACGSLSTAGAPS